MEKLNIFKIVFIGIFFFVNSCIVFSQISQSDWFWKNPIPTGSSLRDIDFVNRDTGYAVGYAGTILKTTNSGENWILLNTYYNYSYLSVSFANSNTGYASTSSGQIVKTTNGGLNWISNYIGADIQLQFIDFTSADTGYIAGHNFIIVPPLPYKIFAKTTNGGLNWISYSLPSTTPNSMHFLNNEYGILGGRPYIFLTSNGGITWNMHTVPNASDQVVGVKMLDTNYIVAAEQGNFFIKSTDGGLTWERNFLGISSNEGLVRGFDFYDYNKGVFVSDGWTMKTADGGLNWIECHANSFPFYPLTFTSATFSDSNTIFSVGKGGNILNTTDFGLSWNKQCGFDSADYVSAYFLDNNKYFLIANYQNSSILKTTNGGLNYSVYHFSNPYKLNKIYFINNDTGYVIGNMNAILKTTNSGNNWTPISASDTVINYTGISFLNNEKGFICGSYGNIGYIQKTTNGGTTWETGTYYGSFKDIEVVNDNIAYTCFNAGIYKTTNFGVSWESISPLGQGGVDIEFTDTENGICIGASTNYFTNNGGNLWSSSPAQEYLSSLYFKSSGKGYAAGTSGGIYKTTNSGASWFRLTVATNNALNSISFVTPDIGYIVGNSGTILQTYDGGLTGFETNTAVEAGYSLLLQNYPNPFNPVTKISYRLKERSFVTLKIFNSIGQEQKILINEFQNESYHAIDFDATSFPSGVFYYTLKVNDTYNETKCMVLIK